jgi:hypothetical protein
MQKLSKFNREQLAYFDKEQTLFTQEGSIKPNDFQFAEKVLAIRTDEKVICPFCLTPDKLHVFVIRKKTGVDHHSAYCPYCRTLMNLKTVLSVYKMTGAQFAKWVYEYNFGGRNQFFRKVNFNEWKERLKVLGLSYDFWEEYKKLKGEWNTRSVEEE